MPLQYYGGPFIVDDVNQQLHFIARQNSHDLKTFTVIDADISIPNKRTFKQSVNSIGTFKMYNASVYGFTYDFITNKMIDMLIFNRFSNQLQIHKVLLSTSVETSYYKVVTKDSPVVEDYLQGVGVHLASHDIDGTGKYFDIYITANVLNKEGKADHFKIPQTVEKPIITLLSSLPSTTIQSGTDNQGFPVQMRQLRASSMMRIMEYCSWQQR
ncbi:hypothetical protein FGO68_gene17597 [Halteria grandinella]|uniref:Uncharacterized protein n=1 Tax=Halteria grandinella TaxID=5974 RepID=A0A8J8SXY9_HALGN|nr:hypothetical protein FGO68_gene17597 [Halteria grandinella]